METIVLYVLIYMVVTTVILAFLPKEKVKIIGDFFRIVLPRIPFVGMIQAYMESRNRKG